MDNEIIDGMRKEGKPFRYVLILGYIFAILVPLSNYLMNDYKYRDGDVLIISLVCFILGTLGLYGWLYALRYRIEFNDEKIHLRTLFKKVEISICDIEKYTCNRYRKSVFYQFNLFIKDGKVLVFTRYKEKFEKVLKDNNIKQTTK